MSNNLGKVLCLIVLKYLNKDNQVDNQSLSPLDKNLNKVIPGNLLPHAEIIISISNRPLLVFHKTLSFE